MSKVDPYEAANKPLDKNLLRYVWKQTRPEQIWILFVILASMPTYFMVLNLPVRIINEPIQGIGFEQPNATKQFLELSLGLPDFLGGTTWKIFDGFTLERWPYLIALSTAFLALVCINGLFKFYINTYKGRLGERMLRRMRYDLVDRVLRFPINQFRRVKGSEVASMVKDEVEPFGEFIGDAFVQPAFLGGQALVAFIFILTNSFWLGMIAVGIIAIQVTLIPYLRRRVLELGRMRQLTARLLSGRIGEIVESITAVRVNDTSNYERAELSHRLGKIFFIRYELYQRKFFIKFINNFLAQLTPFLFYVVGGYFAIRGTLNVGQLIGVINAYKDLPSPINGLIMWDQKRVDINIKYAQIVEQFNVKGVADARMQENSDEPVPPITGDILVSNLSVIDETGSVLIEDADFTLPVTSITAAIGPLGSGAGAVANTLAGLYEPTSGRMTIGGKRVEDLPERVRGRRFAYVGSDTYLPQSTLLETMLYVTKHAPLRTRPDTEEFRLHPREEVEAKASGNTLLDFYADWVDYDAMGISGPDEVYPKVRDVLTVVELDQTVYELAMRQLLDPKKDEALCGQLIQMRKKFRARVEDADLAQYIELFDWERFNPQATIAENLLFGTLIEDDDVSMANIADNAHLMEVLHSQGLDRELYKMGVELAETAIELFADLSPDNPFFEQLNFMTPEQLEAYPPILARAREKGFEGVSELDRKMLMQLPFGYIEPRNRLRLLDEALQERFLKARKAFHQDLPDDMRERLSIYNIDAYNQLNSVQDNILYGRVVYGSSVAMERIQQEIRTLLEENGLEDDMFRAGLEFDIGAGGKRLTENQRQRIVLARALLKGADMLIVNRGLNGLDTRVQERLIKNVLERARGKTNQRPFGIYWALATPSLAKQFDRVLVYDRQTLVEDGTPEELAVEGTRFTRLVT
ncbi:ABC transporter transmembrane domain-containing protein [Pseudahrensia aquimaris]|uniref:ABC transporter transmembrane domain-containing protein n=1 Tax=Pseudahrensia aquimaris TaxID=744461 RepID=A0ABW3FFR8_9HYPH